MATISATKLRRISTRVCRLPDKFARTALPRRQMYGWVRGQGAILVMKAFQGGAWGGPASVSPEESVQVVRIDSEAVHSLALADNASQDERRTYVAKWLAYKLRATMHLPGRVQLHWNDRVRRVQHHLAAGYDIGPTLGVRLDILVAFGREALGPESDERIRWQCEIVAKAINEEADRMDSGGGSAVNAHHTSDFRSVNWFGTLYTFTANQAKCVAILWEARENGTPDLEGLTIVTQADVQQARLVDVFKGKGRMHPAWKTMIVSQTKGDYRLAEPTAAGPTVSRKTPRKTPRKKNRPK